MAKIKIGDLVHIKWEDHYSYGSGGWRDMGNVTMEPFICETVGWVVAQDKQRLATAHGHDANTEGRSISGHIAVCPKRMIKKIKVLKKGNPAHWKKD